MNSIKKILFSLALLATGLHAGQQALIETLQPDPIAVSILTTMQNCINFNQQLTAQTQNSHLIMQENEARALFAKLLDQYITTFGQVYEASTLLGLYTSNYIASIHDKSVAMTPELYPALLQTLESAAKNNNNWGKYIDLQVAVQHENGSTIVKSLTLNDIITGIKNVPLPVGYSTIAKIGMGVAAAAAVGAGAYFASQYYGNGQPLTLPELQQEVANIEQKLEDTPVTENEEDFWSSFIKPKAPLNWQAGGDAELYGAPGLSNADIAAITVGSLGGPMTKAGYNMARSTGTTAAKHSGTQQIAAARGFANTSEEIIANAALKSKTPYNVIPANKSLVSVPAANNQAVMVGSGVETNAGQLAKNAFVRQNQRALPAPKTPSRLSQHYENLPAGYVQPGSSVATAPVVANAPKISPNWPNYFGA